MSDIKLYMEPTYLHRAEHADGGIRRVIDTMVKDLPEFGIEIVMSSDEADIIAGHGGMRPYVQGKPFVAHNHGMMWSEYFNNEGAHNINRDIVDAFVHADAITVPSKWVQKAIARGILQATEVVYHGVEPDEWANSERDYESYIIWNKARQDAVSDSGDMQKLAALLPDIQFLTTIGQPTANVEVIGVHPYHILKPFVQHAGLYLATARETFGIGTLEAMAAGVPIVGWDYGGQREIIKQGETGYLAPYGDYEALAACVRNAIAQRAYLSNNCINDVRDRWQWRDKIEQYANLYKRVLTWYHTPRPKVSVVVPCYNLARFLPEALESVRAQTMQNFECIIIDDASTDDTEPVARAWVKDDVRFRYWSTEMNRGLSHVRNFGFSKSFGRYVLYLDADDVLPTNALELLSTALDNDSGIHIAYGSLDLLTDSGLKRNRFPAEFDWFKQMAHQNQVSTAAMLRREVIERSGGWRERMWRAEDAEFWSRVTSFGFRAKKVTSDSTLYYRIRSDSKGAIEFNTYADRDGNWLANIGWRTANSAQEGSEYLNKHSHSISRPNLVPFGAQGQPREGFWKVRHYEQPLATIIVTAGENDATDILDALIGQDISDWECFVIGKQVKGFPFAKFVKDITEITPRGNVIVELSFDDTIATDFLYQYLKGALTNYEDRDVARAQPKMNEKILVEYIGNNGARIPHHINGRVYLGSKGKQLLVLPEDVNALLERGKFRIVEQHNLPLPAPAMAESR